MGNDNFPTFNCSIQIFLPLYKFGCRAGRLLLKGLVTQHGFQLGNQRRKMAPNLSSSLYCITDHSGKLQSRKLFPSFVLSGGTDASFSSFYCQKAEGEKLIMCHQAVIET